MVMGTDGSQLRDGLGFDHGCVGLEDNDITEAPIARTMALTKMQPILIMVWFDRGCLVPMVIGVDGFQLSDGLGLIVVVLG